MLTNFRGLSVKIGTSRTAPPKGSLGEWFRDYERRAVTSYLGPILIREGYAEKVGRSEIRFSGYNVLISKTKGEGLLEI